MEIVPREASLMDVQLVHNEDNDQFPLSKQCDTPKGRIQKNDRGTTGKRRALQNGFVWAVPLPRFQPRANSST